MYAVVLEPSAEEELDAPCLMSSEEAMMARIFMMLFSLQDLMVPADDSKASASDDMVGVACQIGNIVRVHIAS